MSRVRLAALLVAAVLGPSAGTAASDLIPEGPPPALDLVYTGDVIGYVDPCG